MCRCEGELSNFDEIFTAEIKEKNEGHRVLYKNEKT